MRHNSTALCVCRGCEYNVPNNCMMTSSPDTLCMLIAIFASMSMTSSSEYKLLGLHFSYHRSSCNLGENS